MLDAALKAKWVEALRSKKYRQCKRSLHVSTEGGGDSYCCLGVLNEIRGVKNVVYTGYADFPQLIGDWEVLAKMNDEQGKSFKQIADYIEVHL